MVIKEKSWNHVHDVLLNLSKEDKKENNNLKKRNNFVYLHKTNTMKTCSLMSNETSSTTNLLSSIVPTQCVKEVVKEKDEQYEPDQVSYKSIVLMSKKTKSRKSDVQTNGQSTNDIFVGNEISCDDNDVYIDVYDKKYKYHVNKKTNRKNNPKKNKNKENNKENNVYGVDDYGVDDYGVDDCGVDDYGVDDCGIDDMNQMDLSNVVVDDDDTNLQFYNDSVGDDVHNNMPSFFLVDDSRNGVVEYDEAEHVPSEKIKNDIHFVNDRVASIDHGGSPLLLKSGKPPAPGGRKYSLPNFHTRKTRIQHRHSCQNEDNRNTLKTKKPALTNLNHVFNQEQHGTQYGTQYGTPLERTTMMENSCTMDPFTRRRNFLFSTLSPQLRDQMKLDDVALYSVTDMRTADAISQEIYDLVGSDAVVTDGTACVGGNVISFSRYFSHVNAVELDQERFDMLKHNLERIGATNVDCFFADYLTMMKNIKQDVVFLDPPWGGPEYKDQNTIDLYLSNVPLATICEELKSHCRFIVLKLPKNFEMEKFHKNITCYNIKTVILRKMLFLVLDYNIHMSPTITPTSSNTSSSTSSSTSNTSSSTSSSTSNTSSSTSSTSSSTSNTSSSTSSTSSITTATSNSSTATTSITTTTTSITTTTTSITTTTTMHLEELVFSPDHGSTKKVAKENQVILAPRSCFMKSHDGGKLKPNSTKRILMNKETMEAGCSRLPINS